MSWERAVVIGASGGIGAAIADQLQKRGAQVLRYSRSAQEKTDRIDLSDEASIEAAAKGAASSGPIDLIIVASGFLHDEGEGPEKDWRHLSAENFARSFAANATGPALAAKHFLPLLPREGRAGFAALSARVGSISDNRLGGWYAYRASKAALNMIIRTLSVELRRKRPDAFCIGLHPGTVDTRLSEPFQGNVPEGKLFTPEHSAASLLDTLDHTTIAHSGKLFAYDGQEISP